MIRSFKDRLTEEVFHGFRPKGLSAQIVKTARRKLGMLDAAVELDDLRSPPGNKLHPLGGDRKGQHAIWINDQYRVCFKWQAGDAYEVEIVDYH